jgi:hypothetical protein
MAPRSASSVAIPSGSSEPDGSNRGSNDTDLNGRRRRRERSQRPVRRRGRQGEIDLGAARSGPTAATPIGTRVSNTRIGETDTITSGSDAEGS